MLAALMTLFAGVMTLGNSRGLAGQPAPDDAEKNRAELDAQAAALAARIADDNKRVEWEQRQRDAKEFPTLTMPCANAEVNRRREKIAALRKSAEDEEKALRMFEHDRYVASLKLMPHRDQVKARLLATAPAAIDESIHGLDKEIASAKTASKCQSNGIEFGKIKYLTNGESIAKFVHAAEHAKSQLSELKFQALEEKDLGRAIAKILKGIPKLDTSMVEVKQ